MEKIISLLTQKQKSFYETLKSFIKKNGTSPTVAEMVKIMNFSSPRAVTQYLLALERKGLVKRGRYQKRGITIVEPGAIMNANTIAIPVIASAGCDNLNIFAENTFTDFICVSSDLLQGKKKEKIISIKAIGSSMNEAGINEGDYVLVELTDGVADNDLVVAVVDGFAVIKKIEYANNAIILKPVSSDPSYKPIILHRDYKIFGKVVDVIRLPAKGELEIVPLYPAV